MSTQDALNNVLQGVVAGVLTTTALAAFIGAGREWFIRRAVHNNDMGFDEAIVGYTTYDFNEGSEAWEQSLYTLFKINLKDMYRGSAGRRYKYLLERAAHIANQSDNSNVLAYLDWVIQNPRIVQWLKYGLSSRVGEFAETFSSAVLNRKTGLIPYNVIRVLRNELAENLPAKLLEHPALLDGVDPDSEKFYLYWLPVAEKESKSTEIKILITTEADLSRTDTPSDKTVHVKVGVNRFEEDPDHLHMGRLKTNQQIREELLEKNKTIYD